MAKVVVTCSEPCSDAKCAALIKRVADALGVLPDDVVLLPDGVSVSVVEVPADLAKAREKQNAQEKQEAERKAKEEQAKHDAELKAAEVAAKAAAHHSHSHKAKE